MYFVFAGVGCMNGKLSIAELAQQGLIEVGEVRHIIIGTGGPDKINGCLKNGMILVSKSAFYVSLKKALP